MVPTDRIVGTLRIKFTCPARFPSTRGEGRENEDFVLLSHQLLPPRRG